jgi:hypothetical protein
MPLTSDEEIALRRIGQGSLGVAPALAVVFSRPSLEHHRGEGGRGLSPELANWVPSFGDVDDAAQRHSWAERQLKRAVVDNATTG